MIGTLSCVMTVENLDMESTAYAHLRDALRYTCSMNFMKYSFFACELSNKLFQFKCLMTVIVFVCIEISCQDNGCLRVFSRHLLMC